ncbi:MAG: GerW family sporulation protein [Defluviitaleaceae bacterium]|nr:GerW family sporulation protein [Defluviitaleaceae bacterium]
MATELNLNMVKMFEQMEGFVSSKTVVGEPLKAGETTIIPLVDVSFGMAGGSTDDKDKKDEKSLGGLGAKIKPSAVLVINDGNVQLVNIKHQDSVNKLIDMIPSITNKLDFGSLLGGKKKNKEKATDADKPDILTAPPGSTGL